MDRNCYENDNANYVEIDVARMLWQGRLLIVITTLLGLLIGGGFIAMTKTLYQSTASIKIDTTVFSGDTLYVLNNFQEELKNPALLDGNIANISITNTKQTTILLITVKAENPTMAKDTCVTLLNNFKQRKKDILHRELVVSKELEDKARKQATTSDENNLYFARLQNCNAIENIEKALALFDEKVIEVVKAPSYSEVPVAPNKVRILGIALLAGFFGGCMIVLLHCYYTKTRQKTNTL